MLTSSAAAPTKVEQLEQTFAFSSSCLPRRSEEQFSDFLKYLENNCLLRETRRIEVTYFSPALFFATGSMTYTRLFHIERVTSILLTRLDNLSTLKLFFFLSKRVMSSESSLRQPCFYSMLRPRWRKEGRRNCTLLITSQISCLAHLHKRCHAALIYILILTINQITIVAIPHSAKPAESDHNAAVPFIKVLSFFVLVLQFTNFWFSLTAFIKLIFHHSRQPSKDFQ